MICRQTLTRLLSVATISVVMAVISGCNDAPVSVKSGDTPEHRNAVQYPDQTKAHVTTTTGIVDEIDYAAMRLSIGGSWFYADQETEVKLDGCDPCAFDDIHSGDLVKVTHDQGAAPDGAFYAHEVEREDNSDDSDDEAETEGVVEIVDGNRLFVVGAWFWLDEATTLDFDRDCAGAATILVGDRVKLEHSSGETDGAGFYVFKVEVERECEDEVEEDA